MDGVVRPHSCVLTYRTQRFLSELCPGALAVNMHTEGHGIYFAYFIL